MKKLQVPSSFGSGGNQIFINDADYHPPPPPPPLPFSDGMNHRLVSISAPSDHYFGSLGCINNPMKKNVF